MRIFRGQGLSAEILNELERLAQVFGLTIGRSPSIKVLGAPFSKWSGIVPAAAPHLTTDGGEGGLTKASLEAVAAGEIAYLTLGGPRIPGPYGTKRISHVLVPNSKEWRDLLGVPARPFSADISDGKPFLRYDAGRDEAFSLALPKRDRFFLERLVRWLNDLWAEQVGMERLGVEESG